MKSMVLILWLVMGNGKEQVLLTKHLDDQASCVALAATLKAKHEAKGETVRSLCQAVVEEDTNVDMYGNPVKPE